MPTTIILSGFKEFQDKLSHMPQRVSKEVDGVIGVAAADWERRAKRDAPVHYGRLKGNITHKKNAELNWEVVSSILYSPFLEWGTKTKISVPSDLAAYAAQFKGYKSGSLQDFYNSLFEWVRLKGVARGGDVKQATYMIMRHILRYGIRPQPFFFVQRQAVEKQLLSDIKQILETEH